MTVVAHGHRTHTWAAAGAYGWVRGVAATGVGQVFTLIGAGTLYFGARHLTRGDQAAADRHAGWVQSFERAVGLNREIWLQRQALPHSWIVRIADYIYIYGHWPFIIAVLSWLLVRHRAAFDVARNALLMSGGLALAVFAVFPVAPPRLANASIIDTVTLHADAYRVLQPPAFTDAYAAMPSLHCGWDLLIAMTLASVVRRRRFKIVIMVVPVLMAASVIVTGNHYLIDVIVGDSLAVSALFVARAARARHPSRAEQGPAGGAHTPEPPPSHARLAG